MKIVNLFVRIIKGLVIGASMLIPGVSGGTMAIILGIYDELISAVSRIRENFRYNSILLLEYSIGGLIGVVILSKPMLKIVDLWYLPAMYFFIGAIIASIPPLFRRVKTDKIKVRNILTAMLGIAIGVSLKYLPTGLFTMETGYSVKSFLLLILAGFIIAVALVLPGISGSYILLVFGMYQLTLKAINDFNLPYLLPLIIGVLVGIFATTKVLDKEMEKHPQFTFMLIIGFMIGSLIQIFPGIPANIDILICLVTLFLGFIIVSSIVLIGNKGRKEKISRS